MLFFCYTQLYTDVKPEVRVGEWNAWFHDKLETLSSVWPDHGKNTQSVAELWIGMLRFYCEKMDFTQTVVSIRQSQPLTRFEKRWAGKCLAIEDPFAVRYNLGARITGCMNAYIQQVPTGGRIGYVVACTIHGFLTLHYVTIVLLSNESLNQPYFT